MPLMQKKEGMDLASHLLLIEVEVAVSSGVEQIKTQNTHLRNEAG